MSLRRRRPGLVYPTNEDWHYVGSGGGEPAFENGWGNINAFPKLAFRIRETGVVDIQGTVSVSGGSFDPIFTLPAGYRPSHSATLTVASDVGVARLAISSLGAVVPDTVAPVAPAFIGVTGQFFLTSPVTASGGTYYGRNTAAFFAYRAVTTNASVLASDGIVDASGTITVTLVDTVNVPAGHTVTVKNTGAGTVTVDGDGSQTIDGSLTQALIPGESITVVSTGSNWIIV